MQTRNTERQRQIARWIGLLGLIALILTPGAAAQAETINVVATADAAGNCSSVNQADDSLRKAICYANTHSGDHEIILQAGFTYELTLAGDSSYDDNDEGDLDIGGSFNSLVIKTDTPGSKATIRFDRASVGQDDRVIEILPSSSNLTIRDVTITGGEADTFSSGGGGIENYGVNTILERVTVTGNSGSHGGGIWTGDGETMTIRDSTISNNDATNNGGDGGGGIFLGDDGSSLTLERCTIANNDASNNNDGGGIRAYGNVTLTMENCTVSGNSADDDAGGIMLVGSGAEAYLNNCTITNNEADDGGGGIRVWNYGGETYYLRNTLIANNTAGGIGPDIENHGGNGLDSQGYNIIGDTGGQIFTASTGDQTDLAVTLGPLADNGGYTQTHAIPSGGAAHDTGACDLAVDQRGIPRPSSDCDIGAYEAAGLSINVADSLTEGESVSGTVTRTEASAALNDVTLEITAHTEDAALHATNEDTDSITLDFAINDDEESFTLAAIPDDWIAEDTETLTLEVSGGGMSATKDVDILDNDALYFDPNTVSVTEGGSAATADLCVKAGYGSSVSVNFGYDAADITVTPDTSATPLTIAAGACETVTIEAVDDADEEDPETVIVTAAEDGGDLEAKLTVSVEDNDKPTLKMSISRHSIPKDGGTATVTIRRKPDAHCTADAASINLDITHDPNNALEITNIDPINAVTANGNLDGDKKGADIALAAGECEVTFTITGLDSDGTVTLEATGTYGADGTYDAVTDSVTVEVGCDSMPESLGLTTQTFPTTLLIASYDWLANFYDYNIEGRDTTDAAGHYNDPDTDNFNKIIMKDANLFPMYTATLNDVEFPNITSRNTDKFNDYINRSVAVAPNYLNYTTEIPCGNAACEIKAVGLRSALQWVFVTDPANHNLRRYQFAKHAGFYHKVDDDETEFGADYRMAGDYCSDPDAVSINQGTCSHWNFGDCGGDAEDYVYSLDVELLLDNDANERTIRDEFLAAGIEEVFFFCRMQDVYPMSVDELDTYAEQQPFPILEYTFTLPASQMPLSSLPLSVMGNSSDQNGDTLFLGINAKIFSDGSRDPGPATAASAWTSVTWPTHQHAETISTTFTPNPDIDETWDLDGDPSNGIQLRFSMTASDQGGISVGDFALGYEDRRDRGFGVQTDGQYYDPASGTYMNFTGAAREARWNDLDAFLETVPPESYPGYDTFTSGFGEKVGYGFATNTSFDTAANARFKNPRDIDVFRDYFDIQNGGPTYIFVADTMNSRIQVFMNATGSAGATGADFPIRPLRVRGPNDAGGLAYAAYQSNELAVRPGNSSLGDGRKADWRPFLPNYTSDRSTFINVSTGKGEFYYPHGVAVDQDPDSGDVYLFVADTFNHRIQAFRNSTSLANQPITDRRFNFEFEAGWGAYPLSSTQPGAFSFKYPKGIDVARFANNSSHLYVVDSKNHRLMKYLIAEGDDGIESVSAVAGYGYDGSGFSKTLTTNRGRPVFDNTTAGFVNPQDVASGYSGFFQYSSLGGKGLKFLNNNMIYVTDYARNNSSTTRDKLNMRVMQFVEFPRQPELNGVWLPWATETVSLPGGDLQQSIFEFKISDGNKRHGDYNAEGEGEADRDYDDRPGPAENAGIDGVFTERPAGIAALAWNTTEPIDMRVIHRTNNTVYPNGTTIAKSQDLTVGASSGRFFWFPESHFGSYTSFADEVDGRRVGQVHVFWYNNDGSYRNHSSLSGPPFEFNSDATDGYMKVIAADVDFAYSGRTGTQIFRVKNP